MLKYTIMNEYFNEALRNFTRNFASGGAVLAYHKKGLTPEQIKQKLDFPLSIEEIEKIIKDNNKK